MSRSRIEILGILTLVTLLLLFAGWVWIGRVSWHAIPGASVTINGVISPQATVYLSRDQQEILIDPGVVREMLYVVSLRQKRIGVTYESDFDIRTKSVAKPSQAHLPSDPIPNESDDSTEPHLRMSPHTIQFVSATNLHILVKY